MNVNRVPAPAVFDSAEWKRLLASDPDRHVFATAEWARLWWSSFGEGKQEAIALSFGDPEPVALAVLTLDRTEQGRRLRFLGGDDLTDYQGPIIAEERYRPQVAQELLRYIHEELDGWDYLEAKNLPVPYHFSEWLVEAADRMKVDFELELHELTAVLALPGSFEEYKLALPSKKRHELARKMRRFDREAPGATLRSSQSHTLEADIAAFIDFHRASAGEKGDFMRPAREAFFIEVAHRMHASKMLCLDFLEHEGRIMAATIGFVYDEVFYLYNSAFDHSLRQLSPGLAIVAHLIERSIAERHRRFDFLRGRERYKYDLGAEPLPLHSITIRRTSAG